MKKRFKISIIKKYLKEIVTDDLHRYKSWDHCHRAFSQEQSSDIHPLHLAFYLASWGMYRGSSGLLQKNHMVHKEAVKIIYKPKYNDLKCNTRNEVDETSVSKIIELKDRLARYYRDHQFERKGNQKKISPTDTLISKILLGTTGCVPAYDRYFNEGLKNEGFKRAIFDEVSLTELFAFIKYNLPAIKKAQKIIKAKTKYHYPIMKIMDMYFWQIGYNVQNDTQ